MGAPMARHLIAKGYSVSGYDPQEPARRTAADFGVQMVDSAREVAHVPSLSSSSSASTTKSKA
jgi:3-hydroxyisobutyrate dehydrogenase-like beta-hydroxyacid dehydrogenase